MYGDEIYLCNKAMRKYMKTDSLIRSDAVRGGLKHYDKMIVDLGKISVGLRMGKQLVVGLGASIFLKKYNGCLQHG